MWLLALIGCGAPEGTLSAGGWVVCVAAGTKSECKGVVTDTEITHDGEKTKTYAHDGEEIVPQGDWVQLSPGFRHTCGLDRDGHVSCWGFRAFGQLKAPEGTFVSVSSGTHMSCALDAAGLATCWGEGFTWRDGELPRAPPEAFDAIVVLESTFCGITGTHLHCGGRLRTDFGAPDADGMVAVAGQGPQMCGVTATGSVRCRGHDRESRPRADEEGFDGPVSAIAVLGRGDGVCGLVAGDLVCPNFRKPGPFTQIAAGLTFVCVRGDDVTCFDTSGGDVTPIGW